MNGPTAPPIDLFMIALKRWRALVSCALLGGALGLTYTFVAPSWYAATLTVVPSQRSKDTLIASITARLPEELDTSSTDVQRIRAVLTSNSVADEVIDKFKLMDRYDTTYREDARKSLWEHCGTDLDRKSGVVSLTCEDKDPQIAVEITAYVGEVGNRVFGRVSASSAREERIFLEKQVVKVRQDVDEASRKLREFQEKNKIVDLPEQSKAVISAMASMEGDLVSKQLELSYLTSFSSRTEASVVQLQQQIGILNDKLHQLEAADYGAGSASASSTAGKGSAFFPGAMAVPDLRYQLEQLLREQKIQETLFLLMTQRYEMAKVDEARDTSTFQILDRPTLPTLRSRPKRKKMVLLGLVAGLAVGAGLIGGPLWWRRRTGTSSPV